MGCSGQIKGDFYLHKMILCSCLLVWKRVTLFYYDIILYYQVKYPAINMSHRLRTAPRLYEFFPNLIAAVTPLWRNLFANYLFMLYPTILVIVYVVSKCFCFSSRDCLELLLYCLSRYSHGNSLKCIWQPNIQTVTQYKVQLIMTHLRG